MFTITPQEASTCPNMAAISMVSKEPIMMDNTHNIIPVHLTLMTSMIQYMEVIISSCMAASITVNMQAIMTGKLKPTTMNLPPVISMI